MFASISSVPKPGRSEFRLQVPLDRPQRPPGKVPGPVIGNGRETGPVSDANVRSLPPDDLAPESTDPVEDVPRGRSPHMSPEKASVNHIDTLCGLAMHAPVLVTGAPCDAKDARTVRGTVGGTGSRPHARRVIRIEPPQGAFHVVETHIRVTAPRRASNGPSRHKAVRTGPATRAPPPRSQRRPRRSTAVPAPARRGGAPAAARRPPRCCAA